MKRAIEVVCAVMVCGSVVLAAASSVQAAPIEWAAGSGGNGHYYEIVLDDWITWDDALVGAAGRSHAGVDGHLATLTTSAEQDFLVGVYGGGPMDLLWLGGYQDKQAGDYSEPNGGWRWITGEGWNTTSGKPYFSFNNNYWGQSEEYLITWWGTGGINDLLANPTDPRGPSRGYLVEYPAPEPTTLGLLALGGLAVLRRRRK